MDFPPPKPYGEYRNWAELPPELTSEILHRLGAFEMLKTAQKVCRSWRDVCKDPLMWRKIDMRNLWDFRYDYDLEKMCRHAVDRSQGGLVEIDIWYFGTDKLLNYIADSSRNLRSLKLAMFSGELTDYGFAKAVEKLPLLEELEVSYCRVSAESMKVVGKSCPNLKTLKLNRGDYEYSYDDAFAIAETMPGLRHLQLFGNMLTDDGLNAILDNSPNLEHLDLRQCLDVYFDGDLEKRCFESIKVVRRPYDSTHDYPYDATWDPWEEEYRSDASIITEPEYDQSGSDYNAYDFDYYYYAYDPDYDQYDIYLQ
ncbi:hypothetical protein EUTSA_v10029272mg [Eutrema salsugineum]|uniref:F-box domain-containing protein n=1 Tax=Eutrema salsugineum TaxID=72664 RepID=V4L340_EUTSA|nr:F-box protein SKIP19 [Eutrema salsugineum]ESQ38044.1 hypothetical protein EUTSA_v10029272mg [Eutrema salsugineum]